MHGSRSGSTVPQTPQALHNEFVGTANYAVGQVDGLGWNATIGDDEISVHMAYSVWGWNARGASDDFLGVEFAQAREDWAVTDGQVRAFCWFFMQARKVWPGLAMYFPTHADLDGTPIYGGITDGKTDVFRKYSPESVALRGRIAQRFSDLGYQ